MNFIMKAFIEIGQDYEELKITTWGQKNHNDEKTRLITNETTVEESQQEKPIDTKLGEQLG